MLKNTVSFNDGTALIFKTGNIALKGDQPKEGLTDKRVVRFKIKTVGYKRYNENMQNNVKIEKMIVIPFGVPVATQDIVILSGESDIQYQIVQVQDITDTKPRSRQLSLTRIEAKYDSSAI